MTNFVVFRIFFEIIAVRQRFHGLASKMLEAATFAQWAYLVCSNIWSQPMESVFKL